jgi:hypothetical protein
VRSHDPMGTVFYLSNQGMLPIHDVDTLCRIDEMEGDIHMKNATAHWTNIAEKLSPGNKMTLNCQHAFLFRNTLIRSIKATIEIRYRDFLWLQRNKTFPMEGTQAEDGTWIWTSIPQ